MERDHTGSHPAASPNKNESLEQSVGPEDEVDESADWDSSKKLYNAREPKISQMQPIDLNSIEFSLDHDAKQGYKPNLQNIQGPLPFLYLSHNQLKVIENFHGLGEVCIYKSKRPGNSFELHLRNLESGSRYEVTDPSFLMLTNKTVQKLMQHKKPLLSKKPSGLPDLQKLLPAPAVAAPSESANCVAFESDFEHGNLDLVFASPEGSYTLLLRPDTNSKGHNQWFYFKVTSSQKKHLRLNIINLVKPKSIFGRGGFPYIGSKTDSSGVLRWTQLSESCKLSYTRTKPRYELGDTSVASTRRRQYMTLSFEVPIDARQELWFAYSIPYSYSDLLGFLGGLSDKYVTTDSQSQPNPIQEKTLGLSKTALRERMKPPAPQSNPQLKAGSKSGSSACTKIAFRGFECSRLKVERLCKSESLLDLPMLTITDFTARETELLPEQDRPIVYIVSRVHPSESVSSYSVEGLIDRLLDDSSMSKLMRQLFVFKIVPMMNPDGVIIGNFRTNFSGDDLNRRYDTPSSFFHPSVFHLRELLLEDIKKSKRIYAMMDFHGHSCRRNVFIYGPKVSKSKKRTLRGVFLGLAATKLAFTFEHSTSGYDTKTRKRVAFTEINLREMGRLILDAFARHTLAFVKIPKVFFSDYSAVYIPAPPGTPAYESQKTSLHQGFMKRLNEFLGTTNNASASGEPSSTHLSFEADNLIQEMQKWEEVDGQKDEYSEGGSDSEFSDEDLDAQEQKVLNNALYQYSAAYSSENAQGPSSFAKQLKKDLFKVQKRKKRNEMDEFMKSKQMKARFENLENYAIPEKSGCNPNRSLSKTPLRNSSKVWIADLGTSLKQSRLNRDMTMPFLRGSLDTKLSQKLTANAGLDVVRLDHKKSLYSLVQKRPTRVEGPKQLKPTIISSVRESEIPTSPLLNKMTSSSSTTHIQNRLEYFNVPARLERRSGQPSLASHSEPQREGGLNELLLREMRALKMSYFQDAELQKLNQTRQLSILPNILSQHALDRNLKSRYQAGC